MTIFKSSPLSELGISLRSFVERIDGVDFINTSSTSISTIAKWSDTMEGDYNPHWKTQVRSISPASTFATGFRFRLHQIPFIEAHRTARSSNGRTTYDYEQTGCPNTGVPDMLTLPSPPTLLQVQVENRAISQFLDKAKSAMTDFQSGQDFGELKQTIGGILHPLRSLKEHVLGYFSSVRNLKRLGQNIPSLSKAVADTYLEWTFGWNPLVADVAAAMTGLGIYRPQTVAIEAHASDTWNGSDGFFSIGTIPQYKCHWVSHSKYTVRYKGVVKVSRTDYPPSVAQTFQLLPEDFVPTLWNLFPYSFVLDYFTNVGNIIDAYSFPSVQLAWVNGTVRNSHITEASYEPDYSAPITGFGEAGSFYSSNLKGETCRFTRSNVEPGSLIPILSFEIPGLGSKPWINLAALLTANARSSSFTSLL